MTSEKWHNKAINVVGKVISFWGFKENHGKIWALLFLYNRAFSTSEIRDYFQFSKGATSMLLQDLEDWKVLFRDPSVSERERYYKANKHFISMIGNVLQQREGDLISETSDELKSIQDLAYSQNATAEQVERLKEMLALAELMAQVVQLSNKMKHRNIHELSKILKLVNKLL